MKILDGSGYMNANNTEKKAGRSELSSGFKKAQVEEYLIGSGRHLESFDLSRDYHNTSESLMQNSIVENTLTGDNEAAPIFEASPNPRIKQINKLPHILKGFSENYYPVGKAFGNSISK